MTAAKRIIELLWVAAALGAYLGKAGTWQANWGWKILVFLSGAHLGQWMDDTLELKPSGRRVCQWSCVTERDCCAIDIALLATVGGMWEWGG